MTEQILSDKVALVTGASRGIGFAIAQAYADAGARVVLASRKQEGLDRAAESIREQGGEALAVAAHSGDAEAIQALVEKTTAVYGDIDILVNNAATNPHFGPLLTAEESHWDKIFDVNTKGYFRYIKACVPGMKARGGGKVINIASVAAVEPQPMMGIYSVSKAAVIMLTKVFAAELAVDNIQVNAIAPGFVRTSFSRVLWQTDAIKEALLQAIPQGRLAEPDEVAGLALYLASPASNFTTGAVHVIDGGLLVGSRFNLF
jgi:NAD(P)-dependent dehydrogenase (short-subunit alcohol dehydrogenase family)